MFNTRQLASKNARMEGDTMTSLKGRTMLRAFGYIRVSTPGQVEDGVSLETQEALIKAWCLANGCELVGIFVEGGMTAKRSDNRPELQKAIEAACLEGAVLVVYSLSRFARSTKDTLILAERLEKADADLVSLTEKIDTTSAAGKMVFRMLAVLAEFERDLISERTTAAMAHKRSKGERVSRHIPYGFDLDEDGVNLVPNEDEQRVLELVAKLRSRGLSLRAIAAELTRRGIHTKTGKPWSHSTVQGILKRRVAA